MSVWVPLQDANERNGCLWVVPGSHALGAGGLDLADSGTAGSDLPAGVGRRRTPRPLPVGAGSVVLFSALLWHHSKNNQTDRVRRAFIVSYQEATVGKGAGEQWKVLRPAP